MPHPAEVDERLQAHLRSWLGAWPPSRPVHVIDSEGRTEPGWDGVVRPLHGVSTPDGDVLVALTDDGTAAAGVGRKRHDRHGHELAVVTEEAHRGRGLARRLVTQAARRVLDDGAVPVYLHDPANVASARTADASGFPDVGWRILGLFGGRTGTP